MRINRFVLKRIRKLKTLWQTGKLQRSLRITYDVFWNIVLFFLIIGFFIVLFGGSVAAGYFASLVKDESIRDYESMEKDIYNYEETSKLYFADEVYMSDVQSDLHREEVALEDIADVLIDAVIATEDEYFETHKGIVPKAIVRALFQEITNADTKTGGSTLTQQLIKNQILTNEVSFERKAKEILLALRLERFFDKEQILEAYLNIVPYGREASGRNIAGVQTAAQGIFGIDADEVNLAQAAFLAGLPQNPFQYTPFANGGGLKDDDGLEPGINRMKSVLKRMYETGRIDRDAYEDAIDYDIAADFIDQSALPQEAYPRLTTELELRAKDIIIELLADADGYSIDDLENDQTLREKYAIRAERDMRMNGYRIYSTIDKDIYEAQQEIAQNYKHYGPNTTIELKDEDGKSVSVEQRVETASILIENKTGRIISFVGGREYDEEHQVNFLTRPRSNGSTMKPLLDYAPALEKGVIQPGTPIADLKVGDYDYFPGNYGGSYHGIVSAREALKHSYNIPAAKIYQDIMHDENIVENYLQKMGITTLKENEHANPSLSIGGTTDGITVEENINAFTTFCNNGKFVDAYMIEKITTNDGKVIYEHEPDPVEVFSPETTYLMIDMMRDVLRSGTAAYIPSQLKHDSVDWAGKTGTSEEYKDAWFVGVNPNVTFGTWIGYQYGKDLQNTCQGCSLTYSQRNNKLWAELINAAADINPDLVAPKTTFDRPDGIVEKSYCAISGKLPSKLCKKSGLVKTDLFNSEYVPTEKDDSLMKGSFVMIDGKAIAADPDTPEEFVEGDGIVFNPKFLKRHGYDQLDDISQLFPQTDRNAWEKIGLIHSDLHNTIEDDGQEPEPPTSVKHSGNRLSWQKSTSNDVIGYRIYEADERGETFERVGHTTRTDYTTSSTNAVYHIRAVDYFGRESKASTEVTVGDTDDKKDSKNESRTKDKNNEQVKDNNDGENNHSYEHDADNKDDHNKNNRGEDGD
ncbi:MAG TPA: transglycosylase domain-containing protein [Bacillota bacterium]|nr:transglycosylase domain-containing protein [Bacillota bacterium]